MYARYKERFSGADNMAMTLEKYKKSLTEAVQINDLKWVETILLQPITGKDDEERKQFIDVRKSCCLQSLKEKSLPLLKLLYSRELVYTDNKLDEKSNIKFINGGIESGFTDGIKFLHSNGLALEIHNDSISHWNALQQSVELEKTEIVQYLVTLPDIKSNFNPGSITPLALAAFKCNLAILKLLLDSKFKSQINELCSKGDLYLTPIQWCFENDLAPHLFDCIKVLVAAGANVNMEAGDGEKRSALLMAAKIDLPHIVMFMMDNKGDVTHSDTKQNTALHYLCQNPESPEALECIQRMISELPDIDIRNNTNETPLFIAVTSDNDAIVEMLALAGSDINVHCLQDNEPILSAAILMKATLNSKSHMVETLFKLGCDVNATNSEGMSPLMHAAFYRDIDLIKRLIKHGANVNACDGIGWGSTACEYAFEFEERYKESGKDVLQVLFEAGAEKEMNPIGDDVLSRAFWHLDLPAVEYLLTQQLDIRSLGKYKRNILHYAAQSDNFVRFKSVYNDVDVNQKDLGGNTPLILSAQFHDRYYRFNFVEYMIERGCDVNITNSENETALMHVAGDNDKETLELLLKAGGDVNVRAADSRTALQYLDAEVITDIVETVKTYIPCLKLLLLYGGSPSIDYKDMAGFTPLQHVLNTNKFSLFWYLLYQNCSLSTIEPAESSPTLFTEYEDKDSSGYMFTVPKCLFISKRLFLCGAGRDSCVERFSFRTKTCKKFNQFCNNLSLKSRCRREIRRHIGAAIDQQLSRLNLPQPLQDFILLKEMLPAKYFTIKMYKTDTTKLREGILEDDTDEENEVEHDADDADDDDDDDDDEDGIDGENEEGDEYGYW